LLLFIGGAIGWLARGESIIWEKEYYLFAHISGKDLCR
jgi:hypothetical protein